MSWCWSLFSCPSTLGLPKIKGKWLMQSVLGSQYAIIKLERRNGTDWDSSIVAETSENECSRIHWLHIDCPNWLYMLLLKIKTFFFWGLLINAMFAFPLTKCIYCLQDAYRLQLKLFLYEVKQQQLLSGVRTFLKVYSTISLGKLANYMEVDEPTLRYWMRTVLAEMFLFLCAIIKETNILSFSVLYLAGLF